MPVTAVTRTDWHALSRHTIGGYSNGVTTTPATSRPPGYSANHTKDDYLKRLRRIEGQARGLQRMVEEEQYCIDILTQISALTSALENVALALLDDHIAHCVVDAAQSGGPDADAKLKEASAAIARLVKS